MLERQGGQYGRPWHFSLQLLIGIVAPLALFAFYCAQSYHLALASAAADAGRRAALLAEYTARVLDGHVLLIDLVEQDLANRRAPPSSQSLDHLLAEYRRMKGLTVAIVVMDPGGIVLANTLDPRLQGRDFGDRDYFVRAQASEETVVGEQVVGRVTGDAFFTLSRRFSGGVIVVAIYTHGFEQMFGTIVGADDPTGAVALFRSDGRQLARYPQLPQPLVLTRDDPGLMQYVPDQVSGTYRVVPKTASGEHLYAFRQVEGYPVWAVDGLEIAGIRAGWLRNVAVGGVLAGLCAWILATLAIRTLQQASASEAQETHLRRLVAEQTQHAEHRAAEAERAHLAKSMFLAAASHDLRQPIQGLRLSLDILDQRLAHPDDRQALTLAIRAQEGIEHLLSALLDVSLLDSGMVPVNRKSVALGSLLAEIASEFAAQASGRSIFLRAVPCTAQVDTDPVFFARILRNLLVNALRYTDQGKVVMGCRRCGRTVRVEVWDTGPGIPDDKLDAVFDDFVQLGNSERDRAKGLGLGLAVVRRMATLLGHPIGVRSHLGRGTVFWVSLPCVAGEPLRIARRNGHPDGLASPP